jgi:DMSO/TMAO reductase YedYZ molybdopterin-dependent catalytic subunit
MNPRINDWSLALGVIAAFGTGLWTFVSGRAELWWVFGLHSAVGYLLALLVLPKLWRVRRRLWPLRDWRAWAGLSATALVVATLACAVAWGFGAQAVWLGYNLLNWHVLLGYILVAAVSLHMLLRARPLRRADLRGRRQALRIGGFIALAALAWPVKEWLVQALKLPSSMHRFTGSREVASFSGNAFPVVSWMADNPAPIDLERWTLSVGGEVARPLTLRLADVSSDDELDATLDCTGGFFTTQRWRGVRVARLLEQAEPTIEARWLRFVSITGYRWSLPIAHADDLLLATHVGDEALNHGHGAPLRLVAPGERGLVWVKWLVALEVRNAPDPGQLLAINLSGFDDV